MQISCRTFPLLPKVPVYPNSERDSRTAFSSDPFAAESIPLFIAHPSFGQYDFLTPLMLTFI
ncbi:hypothetical protein HQ50_06445 [Porphyromonas sp. COT-052 OH4946]|nr:hypothetical protein HQ50_06445 [Porphyromonas sp. COT-052 OH4946]